MAAWRRKLTPIREDFLGLRDVLRRAGEADFVFATAARNLHLDGVQPAVLHPQAELLFDFRDSVILEAVHGSASAPAGHIAMAIAGYF